MRRVEHGGCHGTYVPRHRDVCIPIEGVIQAATRPIGGVRARLPVPMLEVSFRKQLSRSVKRIRRQKGLTQRGLARDAGITEKYLSRIELGQVTPSALVIFRVCSSLGLDLGELVSLPARGTSRNQIAIARILSGRREREVDRARRILVELFR
jgi:transcriptional regulator with XRE-family HTH domain